ncbi:MAG: HAMP domain-containing protein [Solirubrobacterales bacterium]|nr:HAMP domain-containing protein [Solirubrobacterales bacterium]MCB0861351.1 HAMP domain-containing protein [Solirubrobacterales bacterium]HRV59060.1 histidine kinase dimerization/phospho-acceptor domain-containing protein [Solirubrobacterales bacterium]
MAAVGYVLVLALIALGLPLALSLKDRVNDEVRSQAHSQAAIVATGAGSLVQPPNETALNRLVRSASETVQGRVLIVDKAGLVLSDSASAETAGSDYSSRPEIAGALQGSSEQFERTSDTLGERILATADPIQAGNRVTGAVRITQSVDEVHAAINKSLLGLGLLALLVLAFALLVAAVIANQISRPIRRLEVSARHFASGEVEEKAEIFGSREQRSLARSFNEMTSRVKRLLKSQSDFVASASHQLRTPLTGLRLRVEALRDDAENEESRAELDSGLAEIDRLSRMVDELLLLSRAGEVDVPGEDLDLGEIAREARGRWNRASGGRTLVLTGADRKDIDAVFSARADLDRILDVLIENAIHYSPEESVVEIQVVPAGIRVLDEGSGIDPEEREAVFQRFERGRSGREGRKGTGLGLAIARELAIPWKAKISVEPRQPAGTIASVSFAKRTDSESSGS